MTRSYFHGGCGRRTGEKMVRRGSPHLPTLLPLGQLSSAGPTFSPAPACQLPPPIRSPLSSVREAAEGPGYRLAPSVLNPPQNLALGPEARDLRSGFLISEGKKKKGAPARWGGQKDQNTARTLGIEPDMLSGWLSHLSPGSKTNRMGLQNGRISPGAFFFTP